MSIKQWNIRHTHTRAGIHDGRQRTICLSLKLTHIPSMVPRNLKKLKALSGGLHILLLQEYMYISSHTRGATIPCNSK